MTIIDQTSGRIYSFIPVAAAIAISIKMSNVMIKLEGTSGNRSISSPTDYERLCTWRSSGWSFQCLNTMMVTKAARMSKIPSPTSIDIFTVYYYSKDT